MRQVSLFFQRGVLGCLDRRGQQQGFTTCCDLAVWWHLAVLSTRTLCHRPGLSCAQAADERMLFDSCPHPASPLCEWSVQCCKELAVIISYQQTRNLSVILGVLYTFYYQKTCERKVNFPPFIHPCSGSFPKQLKDRIMPGFLSPVREKKFMSCLGLVSYQGSQSTEHLIHHGALPSATI